MTHSKLLSFAARLETVFARLTHAATHAPKERVTTDALAGLHNRAGFEADAAHALAGLSDRLPASLVVFDIDAFAAVNRIGGAAAGDRVITALGSIINEAITDRHVAGRIGGEAFAVLLPGIDCAAARLFAEGVRTRFAVLDFGREIPWTLTLSGGVAGRHDGESLNALLARADQALYVAKSGGRDRVFVANEPPAIANETQTA